MKRRLFDSAVIVMTAGVISSAVICILIVSAYQIGAATQREMDRRTEPTQLDRINALHGYMRDGTVRYAWRQAYCK